MQKHRDDFHPLGADLVQQILREMKARRGSRRRTVHLGIDGLIPFLVRILLMDIRRERRFAIGLHKVFKHTVIEEVQYGDAVLLLLQHLAGKIRPEFDARALMQALSRAHQRFPIVRVPPL